MDKEIKVGNGILEHNRLHYIVCNKDTARKYNKAYRKLMFQIKIDNIKLWIKKIRRIILL